MRACHFQDRIGRPGLCLRLLLDGSMMGRELSHRLRHCTQERADDCPHRGWDPDMRNRTMVARSVHLQVCDACGSCHEDLLGMLVCQTDARLDGVLSGIPRWDPEGGIEPLLNRHMPSRLRQRAWRKVRSAVIQRDDWTCQDCGRELKELPSWYLEVHHIRPRVANGSDHPRNLKTLCLECHGRYTDSLAGERALAMGQGLSDHSSRGETRLMDFDVEAGGDGEGNAHYRE
jgi:hypothetical protein